ncbi:MAG: signal recognition particle receptor subunit alpha, partial [Marinoscillum sp.]
MFENLSNKLDRAFKVLKGHGSITEVNVASTIKEIRRALIEADVSYKVAKEITSSIKEKAMGQNVLISVSPGQLLTKIVSNELAMLMGGNSADINYTGNPNIILLSGLQGSGKTTFSGKLAYYLTKKGKKTLLVACDVYRPAAIEQLHVIGEQINVEVYSDKKSKSPLNIAKNAIKHAKKNGFKSVILDTAGRLAIDEKMMKE